MFNGKGFGWECIAENELQCVTCKAKVLFDETNGSEEYAQKFDEQLQSAHGDNCPWADGNVSPAHFAHAPRDAASLREAYRNNLSHLFQLKRVPQVDFDLLDKHVSRGGVWYCALRADVLGVVAKGVESVAVVRKSVLSRCSENVVFAVFGGVRLDRAPRWR